MTYLIREILRNIPEHAEESSAWICGQYWNDQTAEIAIVDEGIGIKKSLQRNSIHRAYATDDESVTILFVTSLVVVSAKRVQSKTHLKKPPTHPKD